MRKQLKNLRMWRSAAGLLFCVTFFCLLTLGGCSRDLGRGAGASSSANGTVTSSALSAPSASSSASSMPGGSNPGNFLSSSGNSGSSAATASSGSGATSPLPSSSSRAGASVVAPGEGLNSLLVLVNRKNALPADYIPADLTKLTVQFASYALPERRQLRKEAAEAIVLLFESAKIGRAHV